MSDQSSEVLKVNGKTLYIKFIQPLEALFFNMNTTPADHWNIVSDSTSENRGYYGTWQIIDGSLYLVDIVTYRRVVKGFWFWKKHEFPLLTVSDLFPEAVDGRIKATWFTHGFGAYTKTMRNPVNDKLVVKFVKGELTEYHWYHLEKDENGKEVAIEYERGLDE